MGAAHLPADGTIDTNACGVGGSFLKLGWIAHFLSKAVVTGFLAGAAVDVVIGELPKLTGTSSDGDSDATSTGCHMATESHDGQDSRQQ